MHINEHDFKTLKSSQMMLKTLLVFIFVRNI